MSRTTVKIEIVITDHAFERGKERLGLSRRAFERISLRAFVSGKKHAECKGHLKKYIDSVYFEYKTGNNIRIYGENIFIFSSNNLVTVYQLPNYLKYYAKK